MVLRRGEHSRARTRGSGKTTSSADLDVTFSEHFSPRAHQSGDGVSPVGPTHDAKLTCKARPINVAHGMVRDKELLLDADEDVVSLARTTNGWVGDRIAEKHLATDNVGASTGAAELLEPLPVAHIVELRRAVPCTCDEAVLGANDLAVEERREFRMCLCKVLDREISAQRGAREADIEDFDRDIVGVPPTPLRSREGTARV